MWLLLIVMMLMGMGAAFLQSPTGKGWLAEQLVARRLARLDRRQYTVLNDVLLPIDGHTTQIDHLIISRFGVFVIETKNYGGWIFGDAHQAQWTQTLGRRKNRFQNPLRQNHKHLKTVQLLCHLPESALHSLVVFTQRATFKTELPDHVLHTPRLVDHIHRLDQPVLTDAQVRRVVMAIRKHRLPSTFATRRQHRHLLKARHNQTAQTAQTAKRPPRNRTD